MREGYDGLYMFPGGRVALEQEPVQAAVKYLQRQTGLHGVYVWSMCEMARVFVTCVIMEIAAKWI